MNKNEIIRAALWLPAFKFFLGKVSIQSKDLPEPGPIELYDAQNIVLDGIAEGLENGKHHFTVLKARQLGISTALLVLDIFWLYMYPGLQGAFVCDTETNREVFRKLVSSMMESLPRGFQVPIVKHDRTMLVLENGSSLQYMSAGKSKNTGLGRSRALNFVHASELSSWGDPKGYETLMDTLSTENPHRLFLFESTALGFGNLFYDCWSDAKEDDLTKGAIFVGWWAKRTYRFEENSREYEKWWTAFPEYTEEEALTTQEVYHRYGYEITPEQWAWYRWKASTRSEQSLKEEFPSTEKEAFQTTGHPFFNARRLTNDIDFVNTSMRAGQLSFEGYTYIFGELFTDLKIRRSNSLEDIDLRVWERPQENARYVIGVDPAYGSSEDADSTVISVWRCFSDKLVQVAEYASPLTNTQNCAWALAHLAGEYRDCMINLEINSGGQAVDMEVEHLRKSLRYGPLQQAARDMKIEHALDSARWFLYKKPDALNGTPGVRHFKTNLNTKTLGLNRLNDAYSSNQLIVRSLPLLDEMTKLRRDGDRIAAGGRAKDDRVMAVMLANYAWKEWVQPAMMGDNRSFEREMRTQYDRQNTSGDVLRQIIPSFLEERRASREGIDLQSLLDNPL